MNTNSWTCSVSKASCQTELFKRLEIFGFFFVSFAGTLLHFAYDFFDSNFIVGIFAPINESTFEHLKLLLYPMLFYAVFEYYLLKKNDFPCLCQFVCAKTAGIITGLLSIIVLFYTYQGVLGHNADFVNILIFFLAVLGGFLVSYYFTTHTIIFSFFHNQNAQKEKQNNHCFLCLSILTIIVILFIIFTISPPDIGLFHEPTVS